MSYYQALRTLIKLLLGKGIRTSYSQSGEDIFVAGLLAEIGADGIYVDVGTYHPILYSNTYGLYRKGWKGIVIDANEEFKPLYKLFRPRDTFVCTGIGKHEEESTYYRFADGAYNTFDPNEARKRKEQSYPRYLGERILPIRSLSSVVHEEKLTHIDFMSIDVEGLDKEVLESHDWSMPPRVIVVEDHGLDIEAPQKSPTFLFLKEKGYVPMVLAARTLICRYEEKAGMS